MGEAKMKRLCSTVLLALAFAPAGAGAQGMTDSGRPFISGGIGQAERDALQSARHRYGLAIQTAVRGSRDYLADVHIRITDSKARPVLETDMDGPWLLVDLPAGRYQVEATRHHRVQRHAVSFLAGGHGQANFYFDDEHANVPRTL
jgi:hypothetical protein